HWTQDGSVTSQFEQHLRAVLDLPLGSPAAREDVSVMVNVLGAEHEDLYQPICMSWPTIPRSRSTSTARACARAARSDTSTPTARTRSSCWPGPATPRASSPESTSIRTPRCPPPATCWPGETPTPNAPASYGPASPETKEAQMSAAQQTPAAPVGIVMGSASDWPTMRAAADALDELGVDSSAEVVSAHRMPEDMIAWAKS